MAVEQSAPLTVQGRPPEHLPPGQWLRKNLFSNWYNSLITIVLGVGLAYASYRTLRWVFITAEWEIVRRTLTLAMIGRFPRNELWRVWAQIYCLLAALGLSAGAAYARAAWTSDEAGTEAPEPQTARNLVQRFWPMLLLVVVLLSFTRTITPLLLTIVGGAVIVAAGAVGRRVPPQHTGWAYLLGGALLLASLQVVTGIGGIAWFPASLIVAAALWRATAAMEGRFATVGRLAIALVGVAVIWWLFPTLADIETTSVVEDVETGVPTETTEYPFRGVGWAEWGGLQLSIFVTAIGIVLAFPVGLLAAIGRRSELPVMRAVATGYIEMVRGVPLITILLVGAKALEFFFPVGFEVPDVITLASIGVLLFSGAYIAEIVRGGLQAVPKGQVEAAQALGLSPGRIQRLIVLPQALRAVIPSMVGQFISLFKDTSLLAVIGIFDLLRFSEVANAQTDFFGTNGFAMTLPFAMFIYWAISYTMSRESQRLERRLGVGTR